MVWPLPEFLKALDVVGLFSLRGKVHASVLERRVRPLVDPKLEEEKCGFHVSRGTLDQLFIDSNILESPQPEKRVKSPLWVRHRFLPQVEEFKCLGVL